MLVLQYVIILVYAAAPLAEAAPQPGSKLHLSEALAVARHNQPRIKIAQLQQRIGQANLWLSRSNWFPQLTGTSTLQKTTANFVYTPGSSPPSSLAQRPAAPNNVNYGYASLSLTLNQMIYDFEQTNSKVRAAEYGIQMANANQRLTKIASNYAVRSSFFALILQKIMLNVQQETLHNQSRHFAQTSAFISQNSNSSIDLAQATSDLAATHQAVVAAQGNVQLAEITLYQNMGIEALPGLYQIVVEHMSPVEQEEAAVAQLVGEAMQNRPDLQNVIYNMHMQEQNLRALWASLAPIVAGQAQVTDRGETTNPLRWNWNVGLVISWPVISGSTPFAAIAQAKITLQQIAEQKRALFLQIYTDIVSNRTTIAVARAALQAAKVAEQAAKERLDLAEERWQKGLGSAIELGDAQLALLTQQSNQALSAYQLDMGRAGLLQALGRNE